MAEILRGEHLGFHLCVDIAERDAHREAVDDQRLGQRTGCRGIRTGFLRCHDEEQRLRVDRVGAVSTETWPSAITSSSADWVRGEARLISSASRIEVNTGPSRNSKVCSFWLNTETPRMSDGSRSGVNCTRVNFAPMEAARLLASVVLPVPG